jgi:hypothetical protein
LIPPLKKRDIFWVVVLTRPGCTHVVCTIFFLLFFLICTTVTEKSRVVSWCYQQFFWYWYFAIIGFNWAVSILVNITSLAGTPFFCKRGVGCIKKGDGAPFFPQKGCQCPLFERKRGSRQKKNTKMDQPRFPLVSVW